MDYASPSFQLLGVVSSILIGGLAIAASILLLRSERSAGAWTMLAGAILALIGDAVPQSLYAMENFVASYSGSIHHIEDTYQVAIQPLMFYSIWDWLSSAAWFVFMIGLMLVALRRRGLAKRIAELESILEIRDSIQK